MREERRKQEEEVRGIGLPHVLKKALINSAVLLSIQQFSSGQILNLKHKVVGLMTWFVHSHKHIRVFFNVTLQCVKRF